MTKEASTQQKKFPRPFGLVSAAGGKSEGGDARQSPCRSGIAAGRAAAAIRVASTARRSETDCQSMDAHRKACAGSNRHRLPIFVTPPARKPEDLSQPAALLGDTAVWARVVVSPPAQGSTGSLFMDGPLFAKAANAAGTNHLHVFSGQRLHFAALLRDLDNPRYGLDRHATGRNEVMLETSPIARQNRAVIPDRPGHDFTPIAWSSASTAARFTSLRTHSQ
jgi:hypothetical protein